MRGMVVFVAFFAIFSVSSIAIPSPLFPGNVVCQFLAVSGNTSLASAAVNGVFYGFVAWTVFYLGFRWVERLSENKSAKDAKKKN
jgi:hypothetical protein